MREHEAACSANTRPLEVTAEVERYLCPRRKISFDGFVSFEGHRYGVPYWYVRRECRVNREGRISSLVKPSCLIVDEVGRCVYDRPCTDLFFDVVDRRYEKEGPNAMVLTSNIAPSGWDEFFTGDDTLLCALDRLFDKASVFVMRGPSYRGRGLDTYSVEAVPQAVKVRGIQPEGM